MSDFKLHRLGIIMARIQATKWKLRVFWIRRLFAARMDRAFNFKVNVKISLTFLPFFI